MDSELRRLRSRWLASQTDEDRALYLRARVRAGEQDEESLRVGVWLGDEVAREVGAELLGDDAVTLVASKSGFVKLLDGLPGGPEVQLRALRAALEATPLEGRDPLFGAFRAALFALHDDPTPERRKEARLARQALGPMGVGEEMFLVMALEGFEHLLTEGWSDRWRSMATRGLSYSYGGHTGAGAIREAVIAALLPWVYTRASAPAPTPPKPPGAPAAEQSSLNVFSASAMTPAAAKAVLARAPEKRPTAPEAKALIEAYLRALGWRVKGSCLLHPEAPIRIRLVKLVLRVEVGGPGKWQRPADNAERQIRLIEVAQRLLQVARERG